MRKWMIISFHIMFWAGCLFLMVFPSPSHSTSQSRIIYFGIIGCVNISAFYVNLLVILPRFLQRKKLWALILSWIVLIFLYAVAKNYLNLLLAPYVDPKLKMYIKLIPTLVQCVYIIGFFIFISTVYTLAEEWFFNERVRNHLEKEKLKAELSFLRSQVNPHFLFNTLNNIYTLTYQKSDKAPEAIMKLSEMMRYMLYESTDTEVPLEKELAYMKRFIALQELRVKKGLQIAVHISGDMSGIYIAPWLLVSFIENTFKHGVLNDEYNPVTMKLELKKNNLYFYISNKTAKGIKDQGKGIGLMNVRRRLELLYPHRHALKITEKDGYYTVELNIVVNH